MVTDFRPETGGPTQHDQPYSILIADDDRGNRETLGDVLRAKGFRTILAADGGEAALKIFAAGKFQVVLVDFEMPVMKGDQLAARLKELAPRQPVVMLTAHGEMLRASGRPLTGVDEMVDKPFRLETLRAGMARAIAKHAAA